MMMVGKRSDVGQEDCLKSFLHAYNMLELLKISCPLQDEDCYRNCHLFVSSSLSKFFL